MLEDEEDSLIHTTSAVYAHPRFEEKNKSANEVEE
jgi:hypothetical protein